MTSTMAVAAFAQIEIAPAPSAFKNDVTTAFAARLDEAVRLVQSGLAGAAPARTHSAQCATCESVDVELLHFSPVSTDGIAAAVEAIPSSEGSSVEIEADGLAEFLAAFIALVAPAFATLPGDAVGAIVSRSALMASADVGDGLDLVYRAVQHLSAAFATLRPPGEAPASPITTPAGGTVAASDRAFGVSSSRLVELALDAARVGLDSARAVSRVVVHLQPAELGQVAIEVQRTAGGIIALIAPATEGARQAILRDAQAIARAFQSAGVLVDRVVIADPGIDESQQPVLNGFSIEAARVPVDPASSGTSVRGMALAREIAQQAELFRAEGRSEFTMQLHPQSLGRVGVRLAVESGQVTVRLVAELADTRAALDQGSAQLRQAFADRGIRVDRFEVIVAPQQSHDFDQNPRRSRGWFDDRTSGSRRHVEDSGFSAALDAARPLDAIA
ncbi:MAG: hypothetical protein FJ033_00125 [Chloroflexi bacterium]|nr:hypothetical protein [Chloroflexota bacterium]